MPSGGRGQLGSGEMSRIYSAKGDRMAEGVYKGSFPKGLFPFLRMRD